MSTSWPAAYKSQKGFTIPPAKEQNNLKLT